MGGLDTGPDESTHVSARRERTVKRIHPILPLEKDIKLAPEYSGTWSWDAARAFIVRNGYETIREPVTGFPPYTAVIRVSPPSRSGASYDFLAELAEE